MDGQEGLDVDFVTDAHEAAIHRVAELLQHPDDLINKLPTLIRKAAMERASVEAQLKTVMEAQLDTAQKGINALSRSKTLTDGIKSSLLEMDKICGDSENNIKNYPYIHRITRAHNNFIVTKLMVERFQAIGSQMARIAKLLEKDSKKIIGTAENLCLIHYQTQQFSIFRNRILSDSRGCSTDVLNTLAAIFKPLDQIEYKLDTYIWDLARNIVELVKAGYGSTIVRLIKVIEAEEKIDEALSIQDFRRPVSTEMADLLRGRTVRSFRIKFFDIIREQINQDIKRIYLEQDKALCAVLDAFNSVVDVLTFVHDELTPLFPPHYNIFHFYVLEYHRSIYNTLNVMTEEEMEPATVLTLIKWVRDYYESLNSRLDVSEDLLEPKLLDGKEDEYMASYVTLARGKLTEWLKNILSNETTDFLDRKLPPEMDTSGQYLLTGSVIAFQMFNQQLDVVASTSKGQLLSAIVKECCVVMNEFQNAWIKIIDLEFNKFIQKSNELNEGLVEYLIALANDCMRSTEFSDTISARLETMSDDNYRQINLDQVKGVSEGFMKIQKRSIQILIDIIMSDLKPAIEVMHCNQWYEQDVMRLIVGTFEDYGDDFQKHMSEYVFGKIMSELAERFVLSYIETFRNKNAKFKMPSSPERMRADLGLVVNYFSRTKSAKRAKASFEVIDKIIGLIESNPRTLYIDFYSLWKQFPDMPLDFVEKILSKREDLDKAAVRDIIDQCKQKGIEITKDTPTTIFSKLSRSAVTTPLVSVEEYEFQLSQVNSALEKDPKNEELIKLRDGLQQLLELEEELGGAAKEIVTSKPSQVKASSSSKTSGKTELNLLEGDTVLGKWSDNNYYECLVVGRAESIAEEAYEVVFTGHESIQILLAGNLRRPKANEKMPTLLSSKEVVIGEIKGKVNKPNTKFSSNNPTSGNFAPKNTSNRNTSDKKSKKNSKRDEEDKVRVNAWQSFAASKGKVMKKTGNIVASASSKTFTSFASRGKHRFERNEEFE